MSKKTKGFDAGKKISGRKTFGIVDTLGPLIAVVVVAASISDNSGITVAERACGRSVRFAKLWCDAGFKRTFIEHCRNHHVGVEVVNRIHPGQFKALPKRCSLIHHGWTGTRKGVGAEPGAVGSPLATLALRGPIGVQRDPTVRRWDWQ